MLKTSRSKNGTTIANTNHAYIVFSFGGSNTGTGRPVTVPTVWLLIVIAVDGVEGAHDLALKILVARVDALVNDRDDHPVALLQIPGWYGLNIRTLLAGRSRIAEVPLLSKERVLWTSSGGL